MTGVEELTIEIGAWIAEECVLGAPRYDVGAELAVLQP